MTFLPLEASTIPNHHETMLPFIITNIINLVLIPRVCLKSQPTEKDHIYR